MDAAEVKELRRLAKIESPSWGDTHKVFNALPEICDAVEERDRAIALLKEIATVEDRKVGNIFCHVTVGSVQRHVRQQLEKWGVKIDAISAI